MKVNQWTLGLAAMGVISLASAVQAEEGSVPLMTALSATTISGYVDTSAHWNLGTGNANNPPYTIAGRGNAKSDGFNLNVVQLSIAKPLDESEWAAGYKVDLWMGPDANSLGTQTGGGDLAIRQAYVALRAPVGNGIDFKVGAFDTIIGYESLEAGNNPNYTRSYAFWGEPTTHTGVLATYRFCDCLSASAGVADTVGPQINGRALYNKSESYKTYMGSVALTAPESWGSFAGSTLYLGAVNGYSNNGGNGNQTSWYAGATIATPVTGLKLGAAYDFREIYDSGTFDAWAASLYASYQATEKLSFHGRGEWGDLAVKNGRDYSVYALTGTVQYDLWKNVISRLEVRWDHGDSGFLGGSNGELFGGSNPPSGDPPTADTKNAVLVAANIIYKF